MTTVVAPATPEVRSVSAVVGRFVSSLVAPGSFLRRTGDVLTLTGAALAPLYGKGFGGATGHFKYADVVMGLAVLVRIGQGITEGLPRYGMRRQSVVLGLLVAFAVSGLVSGFVNDQPLAWDYIRTVIATLGTVFLVSVYGDGKNLIPVLKALAFGTAVLALSTFFSGARLEGRAIGWSSHPNQLGNSCMVGMFAAGWLFDNAKTSKQRWFWAAVVALDAVAVDRSGSRGALLGVFGAVLVYLWLRRSNVYRLAAVFAVWAAVLVLVSGLVTLPPSNPLSRYLTQSGHNTASSISDQARVAALKDDWHQASSSPVWGVGFKDNTNINGVWLQAWLGAGAVGAFIFVMLNVLLLIGAFGHRPRDQAVVCGGIALAIAWAFTNLLTIRDMWIYMTVMFAIAPPLSGVRGVRERVQSAHHQLPAGPNAL